MASPLKYRLAQIIILVTGYWLLVTPGYAQSSKYIRVAIMQDVSSVRLKIDGSYEVSDLGAAKILCRGRNLTTTVTVSKSSILLGNARANTDRIQVKTDGSSLIDIDSRIFRGEMQFIKDKNNKLLIINYLELEDYIKGIAVREISHYWPSETLKAMAIVFRTFALYKMEEARTQAFDVTSDVYSQVYSGRLAERYRINQAVDQTKGMVLMHQGKIIPAFYHSTCAGHTEDAAILWKIDLVPLKGVPCNFCKDSPHFKWHYVLSLQEIENSLLKAGYKIKDIKEIIILDRDKSARARELKILSAAGETKISAKDFRNILGPDIVRSTNFNLSIIERDAIFEGYGWGHGVGLCQWGAYFMAKQGFNYQQILQYYYPETNVKIIKI
ncbi:MAG: SpoIID/LytB domain-containing protein [Candidatus Omnitrophica bacterium]|nr:SpoIID/LytB domain-containing protein [Candidatus Omnitrophota bacterium]